MSGNKRVRCSAGSWGRSRVSAFACSEPRCCMIQRRPFQDRCNTFTRQRKPRNPVPRLSRAGCCHGRHHSARSRRAASTHSACNQALHTLTVLELRLTPSLSMLRQHSSSQPRCVVPARVPVLDTKQARIYMEYDARTESESGATIASVQPHLSTQRKACNISRWF